MTSKAEALRRKKARTQGQSAPMAAITPEAQKSTAPTQNFTAVRPTAERMAQGKWAAPQGPGKRSQPMVDLASDMIGHLYQQGKISTAQEQAARTFQELWASYRSEIGASEYRSCLAGGVGAHDEGDGNPAVYAAWYGLCNKIGGRAVSVIKSNVERQAGEKPINIWALRSALDRVAGA